jgi:hypothetical protein
MATEKQATSDFADVEDLGEAVQLDTVSATYRYTRSGSYTLPLPPLDVRASACQCHDAGVRACG